MEITNTYLHIKVGPFIVKKLVSGNFFELYLRVQHSTLNSAIICLPWHLTLLFQGKWQ